MRGVVGLHNLSVLAHNLSPGQVSSPGDGHRRAGGGGRADARRRYRGPFTAVKIVPGDLGTKGGLLTDEHGAVLREDLSPVPGSLRRGTRPRRSWDAPAPARPHDRDGTLCPGRPRRAGVDWRVPRPEECRTRARRRPSRSLPRRRGLSWGPGCSWAGEPGADRRLLLLVGVGHGALVRAPAGPRGVRPGRP
ncbi:FAD-binding protein [Oerskovia sp. NPDC056781]|uniref:FAD-binding protein n=1 Tax=Oerskovia sp. NPDC056781 TaxID=3345942 RepID=UPI00366EBCA2